MGSAVATSRGSRHLRDTFEDDRYRFVILSHLRQPRSPSPPLDEPLARAVASVVGIASSDAPPSRSGCMRPAAPVLNPPAQISDSVRSPLSHRSYLIGRPCERNVRIDASRVRLLFFVSSVHLPLLCSPTPGFAYTQSFRFADHLTPVAPAYVKRGSTAPRVSRRRLVLALDASTTSASAPPTPEGLKLPSFLTSSARFRPLSQAGNSSPPTFFETPTFLGPYPLPLVLPDFDRRSEVLTLLLPSSSITDSHHVRPSNTHTSSRNIQIPSRTAAVVAVLALGNRTSVVSDCHLPPTAPAFAGQSCWLPLKEGRLAFPQLFPLTLPTPSDSSGFFPSAVAHFRLEHPARRFPSDPFEPSRVPYASASSTPEGAVCVTPVCSTAQTLDASNPQTRSLLTPAPDSPPNTGLGRTGWGCGWRISKGLPSKAGGEIESQEIV